MGIVIEVNPTGQVSVKTNVPNVAMQLGLLEIAKAELLKQAQKPAQPAVSVPSPELTRHLLNGSGG